MTSPPRSIKKETRDVKFWLEIGALIAACWYGWVAYNQWQTQIKTMKIDQRAWVGVTVGRSVMTNGQPIAPPIQITNTEKTPAFNMHGKIVVNLLPQAEEPDFSYVHGHPAYQVAPGGQTLLPNAPQNMPFQVLPKYDTVPNKPVDIIVANDGY